MKNKITQITLMSLFLATASQAGKPLIEITPLTNPHKTIGANERSFVLY